MVFFSLSLLFIIFITVFKSRNISVCKCFYITQQYVQPPKSLLCILIYFYDHHRSYYVDSLQLVHGFKSDRMSLVTCYTIRKGALMVENVSITAGSMQMQVCSSLMGFLGGIAFLRLVHVLHVVVLTWYVFVYFLWTLLFFYHLNGVGTDIPKLNGSNGTEWFTNRPR